MVGNISYHLFIGEKSIREIAFWVNLEPIMTVLGKKSPRQFFKIERMRDSPHTLAFLTTVGARSSAKRGGEG